MNFHERLYKKHGNHFIALDKYVDNDTKINFKCNICNDIFKSSPKKILERKYCTNCRVKEENSKKRNDLIKSIEESNIYDIIEIPTVITKNTKISLRHKKCSNIFSISVNNYKYGRKCPHCSSKPMKRDNDFFISKIKETDIKFLDEYEIMEEYKGRHVKLKIRHKKCNNIILLNPNAIYSGNRCINCSHKSYKYSFEEVKNIIEKDNKYTLISEGYKTNKDKMIISCNNCGSVFESNLVNFQDKRSRNCRCQFISKPIENIVNILESLNINYEVEKRFDNCRNIRPLPFDIFIKEYNLLIEYDGEQHFLPIYGEEKLQKTKINDKIKNNFCKEENINLIRISYKDDYQQEIKKIVQRLSKTH